ncbi:uncharacterized protein LOC142335311 [Convolutriloba macropyga]|uniref:uncharacterized protein LOC142335311 n=1 Tax=Convolutriloba macropyga TaxID=536237 RepID=UPI003F51EC94
MILFKKKENMKKKHIMRAIKCPFLEYFIYLYFLGQLLPVQCTPSGEEACAIDKFADVAATVKITDQENLQFDVGENSQPGVLFTVATNGALGGFSDYLQFDLEHTNEGKFDLEIFQLLLTSGFDLDDPEAKNLYTVTINCLFSPDYGVSFVEYLSYNLVLNIVPVNDHTPQFNPTTINFELQEQNPGNVNKVTQMDRIFTKL